MLSQRTRLSLCQFLSLQHDAFLGVLLEKHGLPINAVYDGPWRATTSLLEGLVACLSDAPSEQVLSLIGEMLGTFGDLRNRVSPRYRYDERFDDLRHCLRLDGYLIQDGTLVPVDPTVEGTVPAEDDLSAELRESGLAEADDVLMMMNQSAEAFRGTPPNPNGCLSSARVALQTLAAAIARARLATHPQTFDETSWGQTLAYLRHTDFITPDEESGLAGVFRFLSPGAHRPVGLDEMEMARLGRSLAASMCYFLVKRYCG